MQEVCEVSPREIEVLKRRVQCLELELAKVKMKMSGKKWL